MGIRNLTPYELASVSPGTRLRSRLLVGVMKKYKIKTICDCGCGTGILANRIRNRGIDVVGFDIHPQLVSQAIENGLDGMGFVADILDIPFAGASVENIVAADVIEHLTRPLDTFHEISRVLSRGGNAIFTIPNHTFECVYDLLGISQADIGHVKTYSKKEVEQLLSETDLQVVEHRNVCSIAVGLADAAIAKLAELKYGKTTVQSSEMALKTSKAFFLAWSYYLLCKLSYPLFLMLEYMLPSFLATENIFILRHKGNGGKND